MTGRVQNAAKVQEVRQKVMGVTDAAGQAGAEVASSALDLTRAPALGRMSFPLTEFAMGAGRNIRLPETLRDIAEVIGREAAVRLAERSRPITDAGTPAATGSRPRRRVIYVPRRLTPDHPLVDLLGWHTALKLQRTHTNMIIEIPLCAELLRAYRDHCIAEMARCGETVGEVARWFDLHERSVRDILARDGVEIAPEGKPGARGSLRRD